MDQIRDDKSLFLNFGSVQALFIWQKDFRGLCRITEKDHSVALVQIERKNLADDARRRQLFVDNQLAIAKSPKFETELVSTQNPQLMFHILMNLETKFGRYPVLHLDQIWTSRT